MSAKTSIEWTERTWNPLVAYLTREVEVRRKNGDVVKIPPGTRGWFCTKCSPGCANCYAEKINLRLGNGLNYVVRNLYDIEFRLVNLDDPLRWRKPCMVFVNSMTDLFHESVPERLIDMVFVAMAIAEKHTFQVLTKRAKRMREYIADPDRLEKIYTAWCSVTGIAQEVQAWPLPNVWLGTSVENQKCANERIPDLIRTPAAVRFLSCEPLLSDINFITAVWLMAQRRGLSKKSDAMVLLQEIHWVIVGCESMGKKAGRNADHYEFEAYPIISRFSLPKEVKIFHKQMPILGNVSKNPAEWPEDLRVRQMPEVRHAAA